jgi:hypothetical protein
MWQCRLASLAVRLVLLAGLFALVAEPATAQQPARRVATSGWVVSTVPTPHAVVSRQGPLPKSVTRLASLSAAPFPYEGIVPGANRPFIEADETGRRFHRTAGGRVYWEDERYSDPRVLLHIPRGFDVRRPGLLVLYFHGHRANLRRDVFMRQRVPWQVSMSRFVTSLMKRPAASPPCTAIRAPKRLSPTCRW